MSTANAPKLRALELLEVRPAVDVVEAEYRRLLGYPRHHAPGERARELTEWARAWYAQHGRPWLYAREVDLEVMPAGLRLDGEEFQSPQLHAHLRDGGAMRAMLVAVSAGHACEEEARRLWEDAKPDEYFFLEMFGSAVVEHLMATLSGRLCAAADREGLAAIAHYSPGYTGWDVADQVRLHELITRGMAQPWPEKLEVLPSGMLRPKKSLLAVVGLVPSGSPGRALPSLVPCRACAFTPCAYRRAAYRHAPAQPDTVATANNRAAEPIPAAAYTTNRRALQKWSRERVRLKSRPDGTIEATFRFDGTTCSNQGLPLAFDYTVTLGPAADGRAILAADCRPAPGDEGYKSMCAYVSDPAALMDAIAREKPLLGRPLDAVLGWNRPAAPAGCFCTGESRTHKWGLALEAIHFALANSTLFSP
ncbi:MAG TPA: hypothetical protein VL200_08695 [Lacunisphaera sp.]|nr:hypothetical protein [Lacunisphaera sp.]